MSKWDVKKRMQADVEIPDTVRTPLPDACTKCGATDVELFIGEMGSGPFCGKCHRPNG